MKFFYLIIILISCNSFGQNCMKYDAKITFKGIIISKSSIRGKIKVPDLDFIRGRNKDPFKNVDKDYIFVNNSFEIANEYYSYDLYDLKYTKAFLPLRIAIIDLNGHLKTIDVNIQKEDFEYKFLRKGNKVQISFNLGEIRI